jgi:hypothetical protein
MFTGASKFEAKCGEVLRMIANFSFYAIKLEFYHNYTNILLKKIHCLSPRANYTDRATAACRRSDCQLLRIKGATWSA